MINELQLYFNIYKYGTYYFPASKHYSNMDIEVGCDRCERIPLTSCIGWREHDLCLECASEIERQYEDGDDAMDIDSD